MTIVNVTITAPDAEWLEAHARSLVKDRLAASGNIIPGVRSIYRRQGEIHDTDEALLMLRTQRHHVSAIIERTNAVHPYETVHVLATEIIEADPSYCQWVVDKTNPI